MAQALPLCDLHQALLHDSQQFPRLVVFVSRAGIIAALHKRLRLHVQFSQTVQNDVNVDVAALVIAVHVGTYQHLMPCEKAIGKFQPEGLRPFSIQTAFRLIPRIEADDVVVRFHIAAILVFMKSVVELLTLQIKGQLLTVDPIQIEFRTQQTMAVFIQLLFSGFLIMLKHEIIQNGAVVGTLNGQVFYNCQFPHLSFFSIRSAWSEQCPWLRGLHHA